MFSTWSICNHRNTIFDLQGISFGYPGGLVASAHVGVPVCVGGIPVLILLSINPHLLRGPLTGGLQYHMPILRNGNVLCRHFYNFHVNLKIVKCLLSNLRKGWCHVDSIFLMSIGSMSHVDYKKWQCRPVKSTGQGPSDTTVRQPPSTQTPYAT